MLTLKHEEEFQITIIDNGSLDETPSSLNLFAVENQQLQIKIIRNPFNIGIGTAYNQGLSESIKSNAKYTVFCNNDLLFTKNWVKNMKHIMDKNPSISMLHPLVPSAFNFYDKNHTIREILLNLKNSDSPESEILEFIGSFKNINKFAKYISNVNRSRFRTKLRFVKFPNAASSCIVMARTSVFADIGFFANPIFKEYGGEDVDICWTVLKRGYDIAITNKVYIHHFRGKSIKSANLDRAKLLQNSNKLLYSIWKDDLGHFLKRLGIEKTQDFPNTPDFWLINELKQDVDMGGLINE